VNRWLPKFVGVTDYVPVTYCNAKSHYDSIRDFCPHIYEIAYCVVIHHTTCVDACRAYAMSMTSVRPSVCRSVTLVNCNHTVQEAAEFLIPNERTVTLVF